MVKAGALAMAGMMLWTVCASSHAEEFGREAAVGQWPLAPISPAEKILISDVYRPFETEGRERRTFPDGVKGYGFFIHYKRSILVGDNIEQRRVQRLQEQLCREDIFAVASGIAAVAFEGRHGMVYTKYLLKPEQVLRNRHPGSAEMIDLVVMGGQVGQGDQALRVTLNRQPTLEFGKRYLVLGSRQKAGMPHTTTADVTEVVGGKIYPLFGYWSDYNAGMPVEDIVQDIKKFNDGWESGCERP